MTSKETDMKTLQINSNSIKVEDWVKDVKDIISGSGSKP